MPTFATIPARPFHCGQIARRLRAEHLKVLADLGLDAHRELRACFDASTVRKAWLIDGRLAALGGVGGTMLSASGYVWLALTDEATRYPVAIVREARRQIAQVMAVKRELVTTIVAGDTAARRFAIFIGFHVAHQGRGQQAFSRHGRRSLADFLDTEEQLRVPCRNSYVIPMGYHLDEAA